MKSNIKINKKTIIYILSPAKIDTGGPTDSHQLAHILLNEFNKKVFMHYIPNQFSNPIHKNYKIFKIPVAKEIIDDEKNILIIPEIFNFISYSKKYKNIQKILWWQSIDNFLKHWFINNNNFFIRALIKTPHKIISFFCSISSYRLENLTFFKYLKFIYLDISKKNIFKIEGIKLNLSHSYYPYKILKSKSVKSIMLSDYIRDEYFLARKKINIKNKKSLICYNPSKASKFFKEFIKRNNDLIFFPLQNYSMNKIINILSKSKIYIDFGFHPGKDHLPREAAILKNCIMTNMEGSAGIYEDLPIKDEFKFLENNTSFKIIREKINQILENFPYELKKFREYEKFLLNEKKLFKKCVKKIFT